MQVIDIGTHRIEFQPPTQEAPEPAAEQPSWLITSYALQLRFDQAERLAIRNAAQTDLVINDWLTLVQAAQHIDLQHADTVAGIHYLAAHQHITEQHAEQILSTPAQPAELP